MKETDSLVDDAGVLWFVHTRLICRGKRCVFHRPSRHRMNMWPLIIRRDTCLVERICPHGIGHPDPDSVAHFGHWFGVHGCDGCCTAQQSA